MMENKQPDYFAESLQRQIGNMAVTIADREAIIAGQQQKIKELEMENKQLHEGEGKADKKEVKKDVKNK